MERPQTHEYDPYFERYISLVDGEVIAAMERQGGEFRALLDGLEARGSYAYGEGKWTIKELISHVIDGERMFAYRALRISRGDLTPIEGFEQDGYIENSNANHRPLTDLLDEFELQRRSNLLMWKNVSDANAARVGTANGSQISARALAFIMAGHVTHHVNILRDRYLS